MAAAVETSGRLARVPLAEILTTLLARRASGSLVLTEPGGRKSVLYVSFGLVTKARTLAIVLDDPNPGEVVAQHIEWAAERIGSTFFDFHEQIDVLPEVAPVASLPLAQVWRSARHAAHAARVDRYLSQLGARLVRLHPRARLDLFAFDWDELACLEPLRHGPLPLERLLAQPVQDPIVLRRLIYVLAICRHLDLGDAREPVGIDGPEARMHHFVPTRPPPIPIRTTQPPPLPVRSNAPPPPMRAYSGLVHRAPTIRSLPTQPSFHPQKLSRNVPREYPRSGLDPAVAIQRAEKLAEHYEFDKALPLAELAAVKRKGDATCGALLAYLRVRCGKFNDRRAEHDLDQCHRAVREHPDTNRYRYYRAWVLKAMGREAHAIRDFTIVVRDDPNHIDAARELHLYRQRQEKTSSGFLDAVKRSLTPSARRAGPPRR